MGDLSRADGAMVPSGDGVGPGLASANGRAASALTPTGWRPKGRLGIGEWAEQGRRFGTIGRAAGWWIGDWLRYGNERFGEKYSRASRITGYDVQTLMNMVYVASRVEISQRRENLSWSHHAEVAALPPEDRGRWLIIAETQRLSVRCLREEIRREQRQIAPPKATLDAPDLLCPNCGSRMEREDRRGGPRESSR